MLNPDIVLFMSRLDRGIAFFNDLLNEQDLGATSGNLDDVDASDLLDDDASIFRQLRLTVA